MLAPSIDPILISIGPLQIRWYSLMYILGILGGFKLAGSILKNSCKLTKDQILNLMCGIIIGIILGGRLGYILFYNLPFYINNPQEVIAIWHGGMSFHGAAIGCVITMALFAKTYRVDWRHLLDALAIGSPLGLGLGRIGNFINGELFGRPSSLPWAMVFTNGGPIHRHPSQLYEFLGEGVLLFLILVVCKKYLSLVPSQLFSIFLIGYGCIRFMIEFTREPDPQIGLFLDMISMGQCLSLIMVVWGSIWIMKTAKK